MVGRRAIQERISQCQKNLKPRLDAAAGELQRDTSRRYTGEILFTPKYSSTSDTKLRRTTQSLSHYGPAYIRLVTRATWPRWWDDNNILALAHIHIHTPVYSHVYCTHELMLLSPVYRRTKRFNYETAKDILPGSFSSSSRVRVHASV